MKETLHIYTRVSSVSQEEEGTSLETQLELGIERSKKLGMKHKTWNEGGQSSSKDDLGNRPVLVNLLKGIDDGDVKHLYVWNTDRLSRNMNTWGMIRFRLIKNEVTLHTPTGKQILSDPQTNLMLGIMSEISQYDNKLRTERFRLGRIHRIKQGFWKGGPPPYGYKLIDSSLVPHEEEKKWVGFIYENYKDGKSLDEIRTLLLNNGVVTRRGNPVWSHGSISKLLTNTHYEGFYTYTDKKSNETIRVPCPPIVSPTIILEVKKWRDKRSYGKDDSRRTKTSNEKYNYLLRDFLICGHCGSRFGGNHKKTQTSYYYCSQKQKNFQNTHTEKYTVCESKRNIRIDVTDELVWDTVLDIVSKSHLFMESVKSELVENDKSYGKTKDELKKLQLKVNKIDKEIKDVTDSIINLETIKILGQRDKDEVEKIIKNLEEHRLKLSGKKEKTILSMSEEEKNQKWVDWVKEFGDRIGEMKKSDFKFEEKKKFLEGVVEKIVVKNTDVQEHELKIEFRLPYVGDKLVWNDEEKKSKGYILKNGKRSKVLRVNLLKKSLT